MRNILTVVKEIKEVKEMIKHNDNSKAQANALQMRLLELEKERQAINWR